jgi:hypothetical protein
MSGGTNKGGTGRPPNWLKDWCDDLLADPTARRVIENAMRGKDIPATTVAMWKAVSERAHGKPMQQVEHSGAVGSFVVEVPPREPDSATWAAKHARTRGEK